MRVDAAREYEQPPRVDLPLPRHRPADPGDQAVPDAEVGDFLAAGGDDGSATDDEIETVFSHLSIVARPGRRLPSASVPAGR